MTHTAWTNPGTYPSIVKRMLIQKCLVSPTCKKTPKGGRMIASTIRKMSNESTPPFVSKAHLPWPSARNVACLDNHTIVRGDRVTHLVYDVSR
jgi:hypothetical protein